MKTLFLSPPSFEGFDGGAGARYQARREIRSFWYPTWLAQPAACTPNSKLIDAPPDDVTIEQTLAEAKSCDQVVIHTSTPSFANDCKVAEAIKKQKPETIIAFCGAHTQVLPEQTLKGSWAIDYVSRKEFDFVFAEVAEGRPLEQVQGITYKKRNPKDAAPGRNGEQIITNPDRPLIPNLDVLPSVMDVYKRDLTIENYAIGYLLHPYISLYTGRGCPALCTFCLWPQTIGGHTYRTRSAQSVVDEMTRAKEMFPQVKEFFFDDDTFTANPRRAIEIGKGLNAKGITWSCNARANLGYDTLKQLKDAGLRLMLVGYESGNDHILENIKKGVSTEQMLKFTKHCRDLGILIHGTFILGLPGETRETIKKSIEFAKTLDVFSIQVSLAAAYPGTELYNQAIANGWMKQQERVDSHGIQEAMLEYEGLTRQEIFDSVSVMYNKFYFRPRPIGRIVKTMLQDSNVCKRRLREGYEFFKFMATRKQHSPPPSAQSVGQPAAA